MANRLSSMNTRYGLKLKTARGTTTWSPKRGKSKSCSGSENGVSKSAAPRKSPSKVYRKKEIVHPRLDIEDEVVRSSHEDTYEWMSLKNESDF